MIEKRNSGKGTAIQYHAMLSGITVELHVHEFGP